MLPQDFHVHPLKPPAPPWLELVPTDDAGEGVLSFYYSEDEAAVPIRAIMLPNNNKSDPNIETATYGLFSTCSQRTRAGIVECSQATTVYAGTPQATCPGATLRWPPTMSTS